MVPPTAGDPNAPAVTFGTWRKKSLASAAGGPLLSPTRKAALEAAPPAAASDASLLIVVTFGDLAPRGGRRGEVVCRAGERCGGVGQWGLVTVAGRRSSEAGRRPRVERRYLQTLGRPRQRRGRSECHLAQRELAGLIVVLLGVVHGLKHAPLTTGRRRGGARRLKTSTNHRAGTTLCSLGGSNPNSVAFWRRFSGDEIDRSEGDRAVLRRAAMGIRGWCTAGSTGHGACVAG